MIDKQILIFELTSYCNNNCEDCLRAFMNKKDYMLTYEQVKIALKEITEFSKNFPDFELKLSGGEPTIWKHDKYDIIDIIAECDKNKINFALVSNGRVFENLEYCNKFISGLKERKIDKLKLYITVDKFHKNYKDTSSIILDNLLKVKEEYEIDLYVQSTVTKRKEDNLPIKFIDKYYKQGIKFIMNPLLPWGRGKDLKDVVPYVNLSNNDKSHLGDYLKYYYILGKSKNIWEGYEEFLNYNNFDIIKQLNCCGKTITFMGDSYYYCMPLSDKKEFAFSKLGNLTYEKYNMFVKDNKHICNMRKNEFNAGSQKLDTPIGYGVCALCKNIYEGGKCNELSN